MQRVDRSRLQNQPYMRFSGRKAARLMSNPRWGEGGLVLTVFFAVCYHLCRNTNCVLCNTLLRLTPYGASPASLAWRKTKREWMKKQTLISRRDLVSGAIASGCVSLLPSRVLGRAGYSLAAT